MNEKIQGGKVMIKLKKIKMVIIKLLKQWGILKKSVIYYIGGSEALPPPAYRGRGNILFT
jgi:hypothetical protein